MPNGGSFWDHELVEFQRTCHRHFVWNSFAWFIDTSFVFSPDQCVFHSGAGLCHGPTSDIASSGWPVRQPSIWLEPGANKFPRCYRPGIPWPLKMIAIEAWTALSGTKLLQVSYAKRMARSIFMQDGAGNFWRQKVTLDFRRVSLLSDPPESSCQMYSCCHHVYKIMRASEKSCRRNMVTHFSSFFTDFHCRGLMLIKRARFGEFSREAFLLCAPGQLPKGSWIWTQQCQQLKKGRVA